MWAAVPQASWRREGRQALPQANSGAAGQKAPLRDFQHPHGVLCPSAMSALLGSRACDRPLFVPPGDREVTPPARKHPSQSRATAKKEVTWLSSGWRGRASCLSRHGCRLFPGTALWKANSPQRVGGEHLPGGLAGWRAGPLQTPPRRPCSPPGFWSRGRPSALAVGAGPGFAEAAGPLQGQGREESLMSGAVLEHLNTLRSHPALETTPPHQCGGWEPGVGQQHCQEAPSQIQINLDTCTNLPGSVHF